MNTPTKLLTVLLASMLLSTGVAAAGSTNADQDTVKIIDEEVTIEDATITISETSISGPGLPDAHIEDSTYTIDTTIHLRGMEVTHAGTTYEVSDVTIHVNDVGIHVQDVTLSGEQ